MSTKPIDESMFAHLGGKHVGRLPIPVKGEKEIAFSSVGGKCVRKACEYPMTEAKPEEKDDEAHTNTHLQ